MPINYLGFIQSNTHTIPQEAGYMHLNDYIGTVERSVADRMVGYLKKNPGMAHVVLARTNFAQRSVPGLIPGDFIQPPSENQRQVYLTIIDRYLARQIQTPDIGMLRLGLQTKFNFNPANGSYYMTWLFCATHLAKPQQIAAKWDSISSQQSVKTQSNAKISRNFSGTTRPNYLETVNQAANFMVEELTRTQISDHQSLNLLCAQLMACRTPQNFLLRAISTQIYTLISKHQLQNTCFNSLADRVAIILQTPQVPSTQHGSMYMYPRAQDPVRFEYESSERRAVPIGAIATMPR